MRTWLWLLSGLVLLVGCNRTPQVEFQGIPGESMVSALSQEQFDKLYGEGLEAFRETIGLQEFCTAQALFRTAGRRDDTDGCQAIYDECATAEKVRFPDGATEEISEALFAHCDATVAEVRTCYNEALKTIGRGLRSINCQTPTHRIDQKLGVPESCRLIDNSCIMPVLRELVR